MQPQTLVIILFLGIVSVAGEKPLSTEDLEEMSEEERKAYWKAHNNTISFLPSPLIQFPSPSGELPPSQSPLSPISPISPMIPTLSPKKFATTAKPPGCWIHKPQTCVSRNNIGRKFCRRTINECKQLCLENKKCVAIEFGVAHGGRRTVYKPGDCQLNKATKVGRCNGFKNNLDLYILNGKRDDCKREIPPPHPSPTKACWYHRSPGCVSRANIGKKIRNTTLDGCKELCLHNKECIAIEYGVAHGGRKNKYKPGDCQLNDKTDERRCCDGQKFNLDLYQIKGEKEDCEHDHDDKREEIDKSTWKSDFARQLKAVEDAIEEYL